VCGIIAVVQRPARRATPDVRSLVDSLATLTGVGAAGAVESIDRALRGTAGVRALLADPESAAELDARIAELEDEARRLEAAADDASIELTGRELEDFNAALLALKDASWAVRRDRLRAAREVASLAGASPSDAAVDACTAIQVALSAIDRLEVRGRDSAGLHVLVTGHGLDLDGDAGVREELDRRAADPLFQSMAVRTPEGHLSFVYKAAAEIGELGDNTRVLRSAIESDELFRRAVAVESARVTVLGHTRWASVGIISEANAHPLNSEEPGVDGPYVVAALNGDVDNHLDLREADDLRIPNEVTTDAKVIPAMVKRRLAAGASPVDAFRETVARFDGSVAIAAATAGSPDELLLALRGSGQALYVGLAEDAFVVASEPYGLVEETTRYVRMDGESTEGAAGEPGQVVVLDRSGAGELAGIRRLAYDGSELPLTDADVHDASITTRDIDRGDFPHFLLKEITESPVSLRKTLRGKLVEVDGQTQVAVGEETLPADVRDRLADGSITRVLVIGQGTAAVAGQAVAAAIELAVGNRLTVHALPATELSGFGLDDEMQHTLVVPISQSGTTTDTNRTVDLARARGAAVVAIVNRRHSDLVEKSHGVLYTADGRDVEMSVASTKAFYAQIAAGFLLAAAVGEAVGCLDRPVWSTLLRALHDLPAAMEEVLARREVIAHAAQQYAPARRYWAIVGNGPNRIAAAEIRIKLSELCYKSIACDATEDKKHIDLSSEPMILVCAAGLSGANVDDVAKEVAIYRAHKAAPIVVATDGEDRFGSALAVLPVPVVHEALAFVLSAMVGHLFGYEAALAIDAQARPLRELRAAVESAVSRSGHDMLARLAQELALPAARFLEGLRGGAYDGHLEASTAVQIGSILRYARGQLPLEAYELDFGVTGTPAVVLDDLVAALTKGIDELTRPVDAIKHQAKTVTVGISRSEESLFESPLVQAVLDAGAPRDRLSYRSLRTLAALDPAVASVAGFTRYGVQGDVEGGFATVDVLDKGGVAATLRSRTETDPRLRGTKNRAARQRLVTAARGGDGRTLVIVPEAKGNEVTGITLLHVEFVDRLPADAAARVLEGYQTRLEALRDAVTEVEPAFRDDVLADIPVVDLLTLPVNVLAEHWRS
jgi:glucosamine--fructose-6-phosphate aminotransferase (isomerizing)